MHPRTVGLIVATITLIIGIGGVVVAAQKYTTSNDQILRLMIEDRSSQQQTIDQQSETIDDLNEKVEQLQKQLDDQSRTASSSAAANTHGSATPSIEPFPTLESCDSSTENGAISISKLKECSKKRIEYEAKKTEWYAKYGQATQIEVK